MHRPYDISGYEWEYAIENTGRWTPLRLHSPFSVPRLVEHEIVELAIRFGTELFLDKAWEEDGSAQIAVQAW